jgi:hypothetical protein
MRGSDQLQLNELPAEILANIFAHLDLRSMGNTSLEGRINNDEGLPVTLKELKAAQKTCPDWRKKE